MAFVSGTIEAADVVVIGGGPAGSAAATRLARRGVHVVQLERRQLLQTGGDHFRSGEGLIPRARRELEALGVATRGAPWLLAPVSRVQIRWLNGAQTTNDLSRRGGIAQLDRELFDAALLEAARSAGADTREGWRARRLHLDRSGAVAGVVALAPDGAERLVHARVVVDAGGRNAIAPRQLGLRQGSAGDDFYAQAMFFDQVEGLAPSTWEMHLFDPRQFSVVQISQLQDGVVRCGLGTTLQIQRRGPPDPQAFFWARVQVYPELARRLAGSRVVRRPYVRAPVGFQVRTAVFDGLLLAGDAAGYLNPLFGDGILRALCQAHAAADAVEAALRRGDVSRAGLAGYARRQAAQRAVDRCARQVLLAAQRFAQAASGLGQERVIRGALLAALMRP